jgi:glycerol kinase
MPDPAPSSYLGAIDQGTSSARFLVFDRAGRATAAALGQARLRPGDVAAIGVTNQRETTVVWNGRTGAPLYNALAWQDTRVSGYLPELNRGGCRDAIRAKTGLPVATYLSALKLRWLLEHVPGGRQAAQAGDALFGNIDPLLLWRLTSGPDGGTHATDGDSSAGGAAGGAGDHVAGRGVRGGSIRRRR